MEFSLCTLTPEAQCLTYHQNNVVWKTKIRHFDGMEIIRNNRIGQCLFYCSSNFKTAWFLCIPKKKYRSKSLPGYLPYFEIQLFHVTSTICIVLLVKNCYGFYSFKQNWSDKLPRYLPKLLYTHLAFQNTAKSQTLLRRITLSSLMSYYGV